MSRAIRTLLEKGLITQDQLDRAVLFKAKEGKTVGFHLVEMGAVDDEKLADAMAGELGVKRRQRSSLENISKNVVDMLPGHLAIDMRAIPLECGDKDLTIGLTDPSDTRALEEISALTGRSIAVELVSEKDMSWALARHYEHLGVIIASDQNWTFEPGAMQLPEQEGDSKGKSMLSVFETATPADEKKSAAGPDKAAGRRVAVIAPVYIGSGAAKEKRDSGRVSAFSQELGRLKVKTVRPNEAARKEPAASFPDDKAVGWSLPPASAPQLKPGTEGKIIASMYKAPNRDAVVGLALKYMLLFCKRAAFMVVRGQEIRGFEIAGHLVSKEAIKAFFLPLSSESILRRCVVERKIQIGMSGSNSADSVLLAAFGGRPDHAVAIPVEICGRIAGVLYGDRIGDEELPSNRLERIKEATGANLTRIVVSGAGS